MGPSSKTTPTRVSPTEYYTCIGIKHSRAQHYLLKVYARLVTRKLLFAKPRNIVTFYFFYSSPLNPHSPAQ